MEKRKKISRLLKVVLISGAFIGLIANPASAAVPIDSSRTSYHSNGSISGDNRTDIVLTGGAGWNTLPTAFSNGNGSFAVSNAFVGSFGAWAATANVKPLVGDFNGDYRTDVALTGGVGWTTIPVAFSNGNGTFAVTNLSVGSSFGAWAATANVKPLVGDFNGDNRSDIALTGGAGWASIPVAFSRGNGSFTVTNSGVGSFGAWAATANVKPLVGDFNGDYRTDIALTGGAGWASIPVAFSNGNGTFTVTNSGVGAFGSWATVSGAQPLVGDFNGDYRTDVALTGGAGWASIPVAFSNGNGTFMVTNLSVGSSFGTWAATANVKALVGDFNGDNRSDVALTGGAGWASIPVAMSKGNGSFTVTNSGVGSFGAWAATANVKPLVGDFNSDHRTDIALTGGAGWASIPVAMSKGNGSFTVTNSGVGSFGAWAATANVKPLAG